LIFTIFGFNLSINIAGLVAREVEGDDCRRKFGILSSSLGKGHFMKDSNKKFGLFKK